MNAITSNRHAMRRMSARSASMEITSRGIRIGIATVPVQRIAVTPDAEKLQQALLSKPRSPDWHVGVGLALAGIAVAVMARFGWLPGGGL